MSRLSFKAPYNELERAVSGLPSCVMKVAVDTDPLLAKPATGCIGVVDDAVAAAASNGHPWNPVPHLRAMWFRSDSGRADSSAPLDGLRALAFLWVVQYHVSLAITDANTGLPILNALVWQGSCGVSLFFVLSGFLVGRVFDRLLARKDAAFRPAYGTFLYRRFVRIWPALMASVLVVQLYATARNFPDDAWWSACGTNELAGALLRNGLFLFDTSAVFVDAPGCVVNQVTWSVSCEFQYYLLTPFFIYAYRHSSKLAASGAVVVALVASLAYRAVVLARHPSWTESNPWNDPRTFGASDAFELAYVSAWGRGAEYCCGILAFFAADALEDRPDARRALFRPLSQAAVFGTWAVVQVYGLWYRLAYLDDFHASWEIFDFVFGFFLVAAVAAYVVVDVVGGESRGFLALLRRCLAAGCFYPIASVSYTGYLFQYAAIMQFKIAPDVLDATASVWAYYAVVSHATFACCAVGLVASLLVERPAMAVGKLLEGGASTPPKTPRRPAAGDRALVAAAVAIAAVVAVGLGVLAADPSKAIGARDGNVAPAAAPAAPPDLHAAATFVFPVECATYDDDGVYPNDVCTNHDVLFCNENCGPGSLCDQLGCADACVFDADWADGKVYGDGATSWGAPCVLGALADLDAACAGTYAPGAPPGASHDAGPARATPLGWDEDGLTASCESHAWCSACPESNAYCAAFGAAVGTVALSTQRFLRDFEGACASLAAWDGESALSLLG